MTRIRIYLFKLLNHPLAPVFIIILATLNKALLTAVYSNFEGDKSFYLLIANNLVKGEGFTIPVSLLSNPAVAENVFFASAITPVYSLLAAPLIKLFPDNYYLVTWIVESLSWLLFFIVIHKILRVLTAGNFWANVFVIFSSLFLYNIELSSSTKDGLATAFLFWGFLCCILINSFEKRPSFFYLVISSIIFILPALTKLILTPLTFVFPLSLLFIGFIGNKKNLLRSGATTLLLTIIIYVTLYFFYRKLGQEALEHTQYFTGRWQLTKGDEFLKGFYPENLLLLYPYIPAALFNLDVVGVQVKTFLNFLYRPYGVMLTLINVAGIVGMVAGFLNLCRTYFNKAISNRVFFFLCGSIISFSILATTCFLSLRYKATQFKGSSSTWTYVYENRPFLFSIIFIQLVIFVFVFSKQFKSSSLARFKSFLAVLMIASAIHGFYFLVKTAMRPNSYQSNNVSINKLVSEHIYSLGRNNPGYKIWLATEMQHLDWYAKLKKHNVYNELIYLNKPEYRLPAQTILLTALASQDTVHIQSYLKRNSVQLFRNYDNTWLLYLEKSEQ